MRSVRQIVAVAAALVIAAAQVTGCTTGEDAVAQGGTFDFVSPGGQTAIFYDPPSSRVTIGDLNGPDLFTDETIWLSDFTGKVVLINVWGSWCAPCRTEMPTLATLASAYEGTDLIVVPVNVDSEAGKIADARSFLDVHEPLPFYSDKSFRLPFLFPDPGKMPQTILLDRQGRIRATFAGEADWASAEARALVDALLAES